MESTERERRRGIERPVAPRSGEATAVALRLAEGTGREEALARLLSPEERARARRFVREVDRARFVSSRAGLRLLLGAATGRAPASLPLATDPRGRPVLVGAAIAFSLSRSADLAVYAFARGARVGVDVERWRPLPDVVRIAERHLAASERRAIVEASDREREELFFRIWTRKEAYVKALGEGLGVPLDRFAVSVGADDARVEADRGDPTTRLRWTLAPLPVSPPYEATLAVERRPCRLRWLGTLTMDEVMAGT